MLLPHRHPTRCRRPLIEHVLHVPALAGRVGVADGPPLPPEHRDGRRASRAGAAPAGAFGVRVGSHPRRVGVARGQPGDGGIELQGPVQQRRHLGPGDRRVRAVPGRRGRAAHGDAGLGQRVDGGLVGAAARVGEPRGRCRAEPEGPLQEAGHLGPGYGLVRAEAGRAGLAPPGDTQLREALHVGRPPLPRRDVGEAGAARARGVAPVQGPHQPHRHRPAGQRLLRAEPIECAAGAAQYPRGVERLDRAAVPAGLLGVGELGPGGRSRPEHRV